MIQITEKAKCCGCTACYSVCPKQAIHMQPDEEQFLYPVVNKLRCINCGMCEQICPVINKQQHSSEPKAYVIRYKDEKIVAQSTSGGTFSAFALPFIQGNGVVFGAGYDDDMCVVCKKATTPEELEEMRGSKFVQSNLGDAFAEIKSLLNDGKKVMFTGTPCQIAGLRAFLKEEKENLVCLDFICRGVPSPGLWKNYINMMEKKHQSKIVGARFKNKTYGYHTSTMKIDFANGETWYGSGRVDPMMKAFVNEMASRPSCAACAFKDITHSSDITMFDCYEFSKITGMYDDDKGYSSLLVHTEQGKTLLDEIMNQLICYPVAIENLISKNGVMVSHSAKPHPKRDEFYRLIQDMPIDVAMKQISPITQIDQLIEKAKGVLFHTGLIVVARKLKKKQTIKVSEKYKKTFTNTGE